MTKEEIQNNIYNQTADYVKRHNEHPDVLLASPAIIQMLELEAPVLGALLFPSVGCKLSVYYHSNPNRLDYIVVGKLKLP